MNLNVKKSAKRELKKAIRDGMKDLSAEQMITLLRMMQLKDSLLKIEELKILGLNQVAEESEKMLSVYDGLVDRKYWDDYSLFYISMAIACHVVNTVAEACQMYDEFKNMKK